ncbi:hypothetical protein SRHO_G00085970 [Serrasalmus rhombeus]
MESRSKVTETLRQQVVKMKIKGVTLSAREVGRSKSVISRILHLSNTTNSFKSPKKAGRPQKTNAREDRIMRRISMGNRFNTAAGIARQFSTEQDEWCRERREEKGRMADVCTEWLGENRE